jgi:hypothetical protein
MAATVWKLLAVVTYVVVVKIKLKRFGLNFHINKWHWLISVLETQRRNEHKHWGIGVWGCLLVDRFGLCRGKRGLERKEA